MEVLKAYAWHIQKKLLNPLELFSVMELDVGFMAVTAALQMQMTDEKRLFIETNNLSHSASLKKIAPLLTSRIAPPKPNASQEEYFSLFVYHMLESEELVNESRQRNIEAHQRLNEPEEAENIRRIFEESQDGHARPQGRTIQLMGQEPESELDRYLKKPPEQTFVYSGLYPWYNDIKSTNTRMTHDNMQLRSCPTMEHISRNCERITNARRPRHDRELLAMPCAQWWRIKRREIGEAIPPEKKRKQRLIIKKLRQEVEMELPTDLRDFTELERYNFNHERGKKMPSIFSNSIMQTYSGRCQPQGNQIRTVELQPCPSIAKARQTDEGSNPKVLEENPSMVFLVTQFLDRNEVTSCEKTPAFPEHFDSEGICQRNLKSCELVLTRDDKMIPNNLDRFVRNEDLYDDQIGQANYILGGINPKKPLYFR